MTDINDLPPHDTHLPPGVSESELSTGSPYRTRPELDEDGDEREREIRDHALRNPDPFEQE
jgi:hypothetical protein